MFLSCTSERKNFTHKRDTSQGCRKSNTVPWQKNTPFFCCLQCRHVIELSYRKMMSIKNVPELLN